LAAEVDVWERITNTKREPGTDGTPYELRRALLLSAITEVRARDVDPYNLVWRQPQPTRSWRND
jgi:hypothetical protein